MKKFLIILKYEFLKQVQTKVFRVVTLVLMAVAIIASFFITKTFNDDSEVAKPVVEKLGVYANSEYRDYAATLEKTEFFEVEYFDSENALNLEVTDKRITGLVFNGYDDVEIIVESTSITSYPGALISVLDAMYQNKILTDKGLQPEDIMEIQKASVNVEMVNLGLDGFLGFGYTYAFTMLLYMMVVMFGNIISSSIVSEKTSKAMELLITSAKSTALVSGKVIGVGLSSILQITLVITTLLTSIKLFTVNGASNQVFDLLANVPLDIIILAVFLFIIGFFSILFLFAGFSSFATKPEDANVVVTPLIMLIVGIFFIVIFGMSSNALDTRIVKVLSFIPIFSPFLLFARYALFGLTTIELVFGVIINIIGAFVLIYLAAKIYRAGTLHYGNTIKFSKIFKSITQ